MSTLDSLREDLRKVLKGDLDPGELDLKDTPVDIERLPNVSLRSLYAVEDWWTWRRAVVRQIAPGVQKYLARKMIV